MRITKEQQEYFKNAIKNKSDEIYLFGSRVDDNAKGGDIDVFILSKQKYSLDDLRDIKLNFKKIFGWQKLDLLNWSFDEENTFKNLIIDDAIKLN
jgi:predicted nucleotidyltransferase